MRERQALFLGLSFSTYLCFNRERDCERDRDRNRERDRRRRAGERNYFWIASGVRAGVIDKVMTKTNLMILKGTSDLTVRCL